MTYETFGAWLFAQPESIQQLVLFGPGALVAVVITLALGGRLRLLTLSWLTQPSAARGVDALLSEREDEAEGEAAWTDEARDSIDELIARRRGRS